MTVQDAIPSIGHNRPPMREIMADQNEDLSVHLEAENHDLVARRDELLDAATRVPAEVDDDETAGKIGDFVKQLSAAIKEADTRRVGDKAPALDAGRRIDGFYRPIIDALDKAKTDITRRLTVYQRRKAEEERVAREKEARLAAEEAARKEAEAAAQRAAAISEDETQEAVAATQAAKEANADAVAAAKHAGANAADRSRARGGLGSVSSLTTFWTFADLDRAKLDLESLRQHLSQDALEKAVRSLIKTGVHKLDGVRIFEDSRTSVR